MDFLFDILFGMLLGIFKMICPNYEFKKWQEALLIFFSLLLLISSIGCLIAGIIILNKFQNYKTSGIVLTAVGISLLTIQCVAFAVLAGYQLKAKTRENNDNQN